MKTSKMSLNYLLYIAIFFSIVLLFSLIFLDWIPFWHSFIINLFLIGFFGFILNSYLKQRQIRSLKSFLSKIPSEQRNQSNLRIFKQQKLYNIFRMIVFSSIMIVFSLFTSHLILSIAVNLNVYLINRFHFINQSEIDLYLGSFIVPIYSILFYFIIPKYWTRNDLHPFRNKINEKPLLLTSNFWFSLLLVLIAFNGFDILYDHVYSSIIDSLNGLEWWQIYPELFGRTIAVLLIFILVPGILLTLYFYCNHVEIIETSLNGKDS